MSCHLGVQCTQQSLICRRVLSGVTITSPSTLAEAVAVIHKTYSVPHVIITSVQLPNMSSPPPSPGNTLTVVGSTTRSDGTPRLFRIDVPAFDFYFSGTGDMFAALTVARLREAVFAAGPDLRNTKSWVSSDDVKPTDLPLARATLKVLESMHGVLEKTIEEKNAELAANPPKFSPGMSGEEKQKEENLRARKAGEVRLVRNTRFLQNPVAKFQAKDWRKEDLPASLQ